MLMHSNFYLVAFHEKKIYDLNKHLVNIMQFSKCHVTECSGAYDF